MKTGRLFFAHCLFAVLPSTRFFSLKRILLRFAGASVGRNVRICSSARFYISGKLSIGPDTWVGHDVLIVGGNAPVEIGAKVDIGPRTSIVTGTHELFGAADRAAGPGRSLPVTVDTGVWIGAGATILGGVRLGECSMVAAGALVRMDVPARAVVGGVPAKALDIRIGEFAG